MTTSANPRVAIAGRHDPATRSAAADLLSRLGMEATSSPPSSGNGGSIFDGLDQLNNVQFAVVVVPPGVLDGSNKVPPPDILAQLGLLVGTLGRNRVCFLVPGSTTKLAPWEGIVPVPMDDGGLWHLLLARTMKQAGLDVDLNRAL